MGEHDADNLRGATRCPGCGDDGELVAQREGRRGNAMTDDHDTEMVRATAAMAGIPVCTQGGEGAG